jgi:hypothetical protein
MNLQRWPAVLLSAEFGETPTGLPVQTASSEYAHRDEQNFRLKLLRAFQLHPRQASGFAAAGLLLALFYAFVMWSAYTSKSQIHLQLVQTKVDHLHNPTIEESVQGAVQSFVAAFPPLYASLGTILGGALLLALGGSFLGFLAAIVVNKLDPRVYIGADIEAAVGFLPLAVLPDLDEVSDGIAAECMLRLAAALEQAARKSNLQTFIVTGTSRDTGVTTVVERVQGALYAIGRPAKLLSATGHPDPSEAEASTELSKQAIWPTDLDEESLVLIDTAPLELSGETKDLARSFNGALVVIRSGVTTRAQLLAAVNTLQRLEVSAVGFVLNGVHLAKADPAFRQSLHDMEKHLRNLADSSSMWPVRWHGFVDKRPRKPGYGAKEDVPAAQPVPAQESKDLPAPSAVYEFTRDPAEQPSRAKPEPSNDEEMPWWLLPPSSQVMPGVQAKAAEACAAEPVQADYPQPVPPRIQAPKLPDWFCEGGESGTAEFTRLAAKHAAASTEQIPTHAESRIERLRGLFSTVGIANLNRNREQESFAGGAIPDGINPPVFEPSPAKYSIEKSPEVVVTTPVTAQTEIPSPREFVPIKEQKRTSDADSPGGWNDDIRILPAKRGQYGSR